MHDERPVPPAGRDTSAQLRDDIDSGRTGDKVDFPDPAAAPLGTDDEAAGISPAGEDVAHARVQEGAAGPEPVVGRRRRVMGIVFVILAVGVLLAMGLLAFLPQT